MGGERDWQDCSKGGEKKLRERKGGTHTFDRVRALVLNRLDVFTFAYRLAAC